MATTILGYESYKYRPVDKKESVTKSEDFDDLTALTILNTISNM